MNLVVDCGNSRIKAGIFREGLLMEHSVFPDLATLFSFIEGKVFGHALVSSVSVDAGVLLERINVSGKKLKMDALLPLPFKNLYATPTTLGVDRIAAVAGALEFFPDRDCLIIDAGTCVNYEFLNDQGEYLGGAISPGLRMRYEAMHQFTARLPLVNNNQNISLTGNSTETCMQSGVMNGLISEIDGMIERYQQLYPDLSVILCGGDYALFENRLKPSIFVAPELVLSGLNRILLHNVRI
jgi:type III pantothenate kinase